MNSGVKKILLFTVKACPMGRSMRQVLEEVGQLFPELESEIVFIEIDMDTTNHFRIKQNPTLLFLTVDEKEMDRIEGFHETEEIKKIIEQLNINEFVASKVYEENNISFESYTIYLLEKNKSVPVEVENQNLTSVKTPRITAIHLLLKTRLPGYDNPFPESASLQLVRFSGETGEISIHMGCEVGAAQIEKMHGLLEKTLSAYGIRSVQMIRV